MNQIEFKYLEEEENIDEYEEEENIEKASKLVGEYIFTFSDLEDSLNNFLIVLIGRGHPSFARTVIKHLGVKAKLEITKAYSKQFLFFSKDIKLSEKMNLMFVNIKKQTEFRNIIAHANWFTLRENGWVDIGLKEDKETGITLTKWAKLSIDVIERNKKCSIELSEQLNEFHDCLEI